MTSIEICTVDDTTITVDDTTVTVDRICISSATNLYVQGGVQSGNSMLDPAVASQVSPGATIQHLRVRAIGGGPNEDSGILTVLPRTFAGYTTSGQGLEVVAPLTAVAFDTSLGFWTRWQDGGANGRDVIRGFTYPDVIYLRPTEEVLGQVLLQGAVHYDDIANEKTVAFVAQLRTLVREQGLWIDGLPAVR